MSVVEVVSAVRSTIKGVEPFEYILRIETTDLVSYKTFHTEVLGTLPQVNSISTYVVLESPKDKRK